jgi:hypothetical protein
VHVVIVGACTAGGGRSGRQPIAGDAGNAAGAGGSGLSTSIGNAGTVSTVRPSGVDSGSPPMVPVASAQAAESGTRLRAIWQVAEDGAKQFNYQWRDTERNEDCSFGLAGDGVQRCMPRPSISFIGYFSDEECTQRLFVRGAAGCVLQGQVMGTFAETVGCEYRSRLFTVTSLVRPSMIYLRSASACTPTAASEAYDYFAAGLEIPPSSFVAASIQVD